MTTKERMIAIKLSEHICRQSEYANKLGITICISKNEKNTRSHKKPLMA